MTEDKHSLQRQADRTRPKNTRAVFIYLILLFAAAIILLLLAYLMQQRTNAQDIDGLKQSVSAMQTVQDLYEENTALKEQLDELEAQINTQNNEISELKRQTELLQQQADAQEHSAQALCWFWQINEAYVQGRYTLARQLIEQMGAELPQALPTENPANTESSSPYERYQEIHDALY